MPFRVGMLAAVTLVLCSNSGWSEGQYLTVRYPPASEPGELSVGVNHTIWLPKTASKLRGVIVHQHGCGVGACKGGETAAHDLHWQALARKWNCALLGPSYQQTEQQNCRLWCDPRNGSERVFLRALRDLSEQSGHPELSEVPWCLWGHSGGGFWASLMQVRYPERIVAVWLRSGTAFSAWEKGEIPRPEIPATAYQIPVMCNPGAKENGDARFKGAWTGTLAMFQEYRGQGALIGFAPDPRSAHECADSRYLAIPFFDACLALRLPDPTATNQTLKPVATDSAWLAKLLTDQPVASAKYDGPLRESVWLPGESVAKAWSEYVRTGAVSDVTPPPKPHDVRVTRRPDGTTEITWDAIADFESGISRFIVERDGQVVAQIPEKPEGRFGRPLFQRMSYHDTPEAPLPAMRYVDTAKVPASAVYRIISVNGVGLKSEPQAP